MFHVFIYFKLFAILISPKLTQVLSYINLVLCEVLEEYE